MGIATDSYLVTEGDRTQWQTELHSESEAYRDADGVIFL